MPPSRGALSFRRREVGDPNTNTAIFLGIGGVAILAILLLLLSYSLRQQRMRSPEPPRWVPSFLRSRWRNWKPKYQSTASSSRRTGGPDTSSIDVRSSSDGRSALGGVSAMETELDRRQSVRSILTLPPYHVAPLPSETLIAREGERAGVDTIIDLPETEAEVEGRREDEMQALYNVRESRRREAADREERREERRLARTRGDWTRLEQLEQESRNRARQRARDEQTLLSAIDAEQRGRGLGPLNATSQQLIAELSAVREANARSRRVSSVSYADLGTARHDGSRLRGDSVESSDHRPLLDSAASFGSRSRAVSRAGSDNGASRAASLTRPAPSHQRHASTGAASYLSDESNRRPSIGAPALLTPGSSEDLPPHPPSYEDDVSVHGGEAPPYQGPENTSHSQSYENGTGQAQQRSANDSADGSSPTMDTPSSSTSDGASAPGLVGPASMLPALARLQTSGAAPSVEVTSATPTNSVPPTPIGGLSRSGTSESRWEGRGK